MKIKRFNESLKGDWKPTDKVLKVSIADFEVNIEDIENTNDYVDQYDHWYSETKDKVRARNYAIYHGIEEWIYREKDVQIKFVMVDGTDTIIKNEKEFDKFTKNVGKYNL